MTSSTVAFRNSGKRAAWRNQFDVLRAEHLREQDRMQIVMKRCQGAFWSKPELHRSGPVIIAVDDVSRRLQIASQVGQGRLIEKHVASHKIIIVRLWFSPIRIAYSDKKFNSGRGSHAYIELQLVGSIAFDKLVHGLRHFSSVKPGIVKHVRLTLILAQRSHAHELRLLL